MDASILIKNIEDNLDNIFDEEKYKEFLGCISRFHNYSILNQILILMQCPDAFKVAGYVSWNKMGRQVKKGEKHIDILAPKYSTFYVRRDTGERIRARSLSKKEIEDALRVGILKKEKSLNGFLGVSVFDIGQTIPLPGTEDTSDGVRLDIEGLRGNFNDMDKIVEAVKDATGASVEITKNIGNLEVMGYYSKATNSIVVRELDGAQVAKTLLHEASHAVAKKLTTDGRIIKVGDNEPEDKILKLRRDDEEVIVESAAYAVMLHLGINVSEYSFGYVHNWATAYRGKENGKEQLLNNLKYVRAIVSTLIESVEKVFGTTEMNRCDGEDVHTKEEAVSDTLTMLEANSARLKVSGEAWV